MGLNIGIEVRKQPEEYMSHGCNPKGDLLDVEEGFFAFLHTKFPDGGFGKGWVSLRRERDGAEWYDFDVRLFGYGSQIDSDTMYLAITEYIYQHFSHVEGIEMRTYWSG